MTILGTVQWDDFNRGVAKHLDPDVVTVYRTPPDPVTGQLRARALWAVPVDGVDSGIEELDGKVPIQFTNPEDVYFPAILPVFRIGQPDITPAMDRQPWYHMVARAPAAGAQPVMLPTGETGYTAYETQWRADPFDLTYDIVILGRRREDAKRMLAHVMRRCPIPAFAVAVTDSIGDERTYSAQDLAYSDISEIADVADRAIGWMLSFTVKAEIDVADSTTTPAFTGASALDPTDPYWGSYALNLRLHVGLDQEQW